MDTVEQGGGYCNRWDEEMPVSLDLMSSSEGDTVHECEVFLQYENTRIQERMILDTIGS